MVVNVIKFPVLYFSQSLCNIARSIDEISICKKGALSNGFFNNLLLVDISGKKYRVSSAKKLHGVGPFWGYNIFLNQTVKVELSFDGEPKEITLEEVKKMIFQSFQKWHGWSTRGDFEGLQEKVINAKSISEIIKLLS